MKLKRNFSLGGAALAVGLALGGCVERSLTIATDPPGALVSLNDLPVGRSTLVVPFTWYGDYDVRLELVRNEGTAEKPVLKRYYLHTNKKTEVPVHQWLGLDLLADIAPWQIRDDQLWAFILQPVNDPPDEDLVKRAKELQARLGEPEALQPKEKAAKAAARAAAAAAATMPKAGPATAPAPKAATQPAKGP